MCLMDIQPSAFMCVEPEEGIKENSLYINLHENS